MKNSKFVIENLDALRKYAGQELGVSEPIDISRERVETFCRSVDNTEWIHWDADRCANSALKGPIMPGFMAPALFSKVFFDMVDVQGIPNMLFAGTDRIRLLAPVRIGSKLVFSTKIGRVEERSVGIAVYYDTRWSVQGDDQPVGVATFIIRYW